MNAKEFLNIVEPFQDKLYRLAKRLLVSKDEAADATQEVLYKLWKNKSKIAGYSSIEAFSLTMTKNYCLDRLKSKQAATLKIVHNTYQSNERSIDQELEREQLFRFVKDIIDTLPDKQKIVIQLRDVEGYDYESIAKILDMKEDSVRVTLSRARKKIKQVLEEKKYYGAL